MNNLLPPKQKKLNRSEYRFRFLSLAMLLGSGVLLVFVVLSLPAHRLLSAWPDDLKAAASSARATAASYKELQEEVHAGNLLVKHLENREEGRRFSELIEVIDKLAGQEVVITQYSFGDKKKSFTLVGSAATRSGLSVFRNRLERDSHFRSVELPISNLAKETDLAFTMTVKLVTENEDE